MIRLFVFCWLFFGAGLVVHVLHCTREMRMIGTKNVISCWGYRISLPVNGSGRIRYAVHKYIYIHIRGAFYRLVWCLCVCKLCRKSRSMLIDWLCMLRKLELIISSCLFVVFGLVQVHGPAFCKMFQMLRIRFIPQVGLNIYTYICHFLSVIIQNCVDEHVLSFFIIWLLVAVGSYFVGTLNVEYNLHDRPRKSK